MTNRVLVCGGRNYNDQGRVFKELDKLHLGSPVELVIEGGANGADQQARFWALSKGIPCMTIHACWQSLGRKAGPMRNEWMIQFGQPTLCVAFPGGTGTDNMKKTALAHDVSVMQVGP